MALTKGEVLQVLGKTITKVGDAFEDEQTPNEVTKDEILNIVTSSVQDVLKEYAD